MILTKIKNIILIIKNKFSSPEVIFLIGLPGSGKKHYAETMKNDYEYKNHKLLSIDNTIESIARIKGKTYNEIYEKELVDIEEYFMLRINVSVEKRESIIINNHNNISKECRTKILKLIPSTYYKKAIIFHASLEDIQRRIYLREIAKSTTISHETINNLLAKYKHPDKTEFDEVILAKYKHPDKTEFDEVIKA